MSRALQSLNSLSPLVLSIGEPTFVNHLLGSQHRSARRRDHGLPGQQPGQLEYVFSASDRASIYALSQLLSAQYVQGELEDRPRDEREPRQLSPATDYAHAPGDQCAATPADIVTIGKPWTLVTGSRSGAARARRRFSCTPTASAAPVCSRKTISIFCSRSRTSAQRQYRSIARWPPRPRPYL